MKTTYKAKAAKENNKYYPVVWFLSNGISDNYFINDPQETRSKALTIAKNTIKNLSN